MAIKEFHDFSVDVHCRCGRDMEPSPGRGVGWYRCGCGMSVRARPMDAELDKPEYCQVWKTGGVRCGQIVIPVGGWPGAISGYAAGGMMCADCAFVVLRGALQQQETRGWIVEELARQEIDEVRQRLAMEDYREEQRKRQEEQAYKQQRLADATHIVYYVRLGENHIKIGTTARLPQRMVELRVANRTNLLAAEPGDHAVEKQRHDMFASLRYDRRKEDFAESPALLAHIEMVRAEFGDPWELPHHIPAQRDGDAEMSEAPT